MKPYFRILSVGKPDKVLRVKKQVDFKSANVELDIRIKQLKMMKKKKRIALGAHDNKKKIWWIGFSSIGKNSLCTT